jgi:hypothetical protein
MEVGTPDARGAIRGIVPFRDGDAKDVAHAAQGLDRFGKEGMVMEQRHANGGGEIQQRAQKCDPSLLEAQPIVRVKDHAPYSSG